MSDHHREERAGRVAFGMIPVGVVADVAAEERRDVRGCRECFLQANRPLNRAAKLAAAVNCECATNSTVDTHGLLLCVVRLGGLCQPGLRAHRVSER